MRRAWREGGWRGALLNVVGFPLEVLYRAAVAFRDQAYRSGVRSSAHVPIPVISVGNVVVGGTGKTPVSAWICRRLVEMGRTPALLTRGYGMDEVALHRRWNPDVPVHVDANRVRGALDAKESGADVLVMDDGFQHRGLARDLDVVLVSAEQPVSWRLLPRGPYRERPSSLSRADVVVLTSRSATAETVQAWQARLARLAPHATHASLQLVARRWTTISGEDHEAPEGDLLAVCSVAEPASFVRMLAVEASGTVELMAFADHHAYDSRDIDRIRKVAGSRAIVTTEKDAVKLEGFAGDQLPDVRVVGLELEWRSGLGALGALLADALERT